MAAPPYQSDFYNNVAAIAVVLMFTKVVGHGLRKGRAKHPHPGMLKTLHIGVVVGAVIAATVALIATFQGSHWGFSHILAWAALGFTAFCLVSDILIEELDLDRRWPLKRWLPGGHERSASSGHVRADHR